VRDVSNSPGSILVTESTEDSRSFSGTSMTFFGRSIGISEGVGESAAIVESRWAWASLAICVHGNFPDLLLEADIWRVDGSWTGVA
jgi:hypothetical protein